MDHSSLPIAVILAAGVGRRLAPFTDDRPKALVEVEGRTFLERALTAVEAAGFKRIAIVTGHCAEMIDAAVRDGGWQFDVRCVVNPSYATANNIVSFLTVEDEILDGFCLLNSDIVFDAAILRDVARAGAGCWLAVDTDEPLGDEEMKVQVDERGLVRRVSKRLAPEVSAGEYIGIARFDAAGAAAVVRHARHLVAHGQTDLYYEDAFDRAASELAIAMVPVRGRSWTEVDDLTDYQRAIHVARALDAPPGR
ncbi:MAG: phosphocholine cytidylyltransferase family protein [Chloroflexota bacterium]|nr:phosphocholine cytidylyltransferase family protein [Chloroflexota bacterium]